MQDIQLHYSGTLHLIESDPSDGAGGLPPTAAKHFLSDWRAGLISLAGHNFDSTELSLAVRFWRGVGSEFLSRVCHLPPFKVDLKVETPTTAEVGHWLLSAPPMAGGEYLRDGTLLLLWEQLNQWTLEQLREEGYLEGFLLRWAPAWQRVGQVTFHLAQNKKDAARPFAFMATFTTGLGADGKDKYLPLQQALQLYSGKKNRAALSKLLTPIHEAASGSPWVAEMVESGAIYRPAAWTAQQAHNFLLSITNLEESGLMVRIPDWWKKRPKARVQVQIDQQKASLLGADSLLQLNVGVMLGGHELNPTEIARLLQEEDKLVLFKGQWVEVDHHKLQKVLDHWNAVADSLEGGELNFQEGLRLLAGTSADLKEDAELDVDWSEVIAGKNLRKLLDRLRNPDGEKLPPIEAGLKKVLRPYQQHGVSWLHLLTELGLGACLADDMGLGKTLQVLALLTAGQKRPGESSSLLVVPASLLGNWKAEAEKFAPGLKLQFLHSSMTSRQQMDEIADDPENALDQTDLVVTTYSMTHRLDWLKEQHWRMVILDEAQAIKNHGTRQSRAVRKMKASARVALTGTPVENRLGDLWSLFDFLNPGLLGSATVFKKFIQSLEDSGFEPLRRLIGPYILRRLKTDRKVITDLPDKIETVRYCQLSKQQVTLYKKVVRELKRGLEAVDEGIERRGLVLQTLTRLKQVCNHPSQLVGNQEYQPQHSGKFVRIQEICSELAERQEKVLVFTQYRDVIPYLEEHLARVFGRPGLVLHGGTRPNQRTKLVEAFQKQDGPPFFVISLRAGGTGLNLTQASHVIHFDRWWNPAVENQATDRAFRIGQTQNVLVHKFVTAGTVEEKIDQMINEKQQLSNKVLGGEEIKLTELSDDELLALVQLDVTGL